VDRGVPGMTWGPIAGARSTATSIFLEQGAGAG
jgi:hypothetical protein